MAAVYEWVRNITYYMIFITVAGNLLADSKYEKYLRFFAGTVLILLVLKPLTGSLRLDERIAYLFESITFQNESGDFQEKLWGMEDERLNQVMGTYEDAVAVDLRSMADTAGYRCGQVKVQIETDPNSPYYGHVTGIYMKVGKRREEGGSALPSISGTGTAPFSREKIEVKPVKIGDETEETWPAGSGPETGATAGSGPETGATAGSGPETGASGAAAPGQSVSGDSSQKAAPSLPADTEERAKLNGFLRKVAGYYGLETTNVQMEWEDD